MKIGVLSVLVGISAFVAAGNCAAQTLDAPLHIDIPTKLDHANVVIDFGHAVYSGDSLYALGDLNLIADDVRKWDAKGLIVVVLHGDAAYLILNDESYNANRHVATGNPYREILDGLMEKAFGSSYAAPRRKQTTGEMPICCRASRSM